MRGWREHAKRLVGGLTGAGPLLDGRWQDAVLNVPRHLFLPDTTDPVTLTEQELTTIYSDPWLSLNLATPATQGETGTWAPPSVLAWTLDQLGQDRWAGPQRVLQAGVGSGYLTALLCFGLGDRHVVATEPDPALVTGTRAALADLGWQPEIVTGCPGRLTAEYGGYDVVLAVEPSPAPERPAGPRVGRERVACLSQLTSRGRMFVAGPSDPFATHPVAVINRSSTGRLSCDVHDPHSSIRGDRLFVEFLIEDNHLRDALLAGHVADTDGCCHACAEDHGTVEPAPCRVRVIAQAAADLATRHTSPRSDAGAVHDFSRSPHANPGSLGE